MQLKRHSLEGEIKWFPPGSMHNVSSDECPCTVSKDKFDIYLLTGGINPRQTLVLPEKFCRARTLAAMLWRPPNAQFCHQCQSALIHLRRLLCPSMLATLWQMPALHGYYSVPHMARQTTTKFGCSATCTWQFGSH